MTSIYFGVNTPILWSHQTLQNRSWEYLHVFPHVSTSAGYEVYQRPSCNPVYTSTWVDNKHCSTNESPDGDLALWKNTLSISSQIFSFPQTRPQSACELPVKSRTPGVRKGAYGTLGNLPAAFWVLNLFSVHEMQAIAVLGFEEVAERRNNKKSKPQKGSIFF